MGQPEEAIVQGWLLSTPKYDSHHQEETINYCLFLPSIVHGQMVDEANIKLMRDYVLETSHIEDDK